VRNVLIGQTDYSIVVRITGADGAPETGLAHTDIDIAYTRVETDNDVTTADVAPANLTALTDAHSDWGWEEISSTDHPGLYRLDIADAVFASGAWEAVVTITDASGSDFYAHDIGFRLVNIDPQASNLPANVTQFGGSNGTFSSGRPEVNTTHWGGTAVASANVLIDGAITAAKIASDALTAAKFAADCITAAKLASDVTTEIQSGLATAAELDKVPKSDGTTTWNATAAAQIQTEANDALVANHLDHLLAATYDPASKPGASDALLNELVENDGGVARYTANALELAPTGGSAPTVEQIRTEMDDNSTKLASIVADTNELQTDWTNGGRLDLILDARASQTSVDDVPTNAELATALAAADDAVLAAIAALNNLSQANIRTAIGLGSANLDTQLADLPTNSELSTALASADDAVLAAIAALNNLSIANVRTAVGLASANLDTQLDALPTAAELSTALAAADDAVLAAIAALNNLSSAQAETAAAAALTAYDPPTKAELDTAVDALPTAAENAAAILAAGDVDGYSLEETLKLCLAALAGKLSGAATTTIEIRAADDSKVRITATVDEDGNRTSVTLDEAG
jgi:hypothetical protein